MFESLKKAHTHNSHIHGWYVICVYVCMCLPYQNSDGDDVLDASLHGKDTAKRRRSKGDKATITMAREN